ncbi:MAG: right-handed parallel beta-helix repeat-containing protein [Desulfobaccales bacterium]
MRKFLRRILPLLAVALWSLQAWGGQWSPHGFLYKPGMGARGAQEKAFFDAGCDRLDARLGKEIWVGDPNYGATLQTAVAVIGTTPAVLRLPAGAWDISSDVSIPANVALKPERGAILSRTGGAHLTINGPFICGLWAAFNDNSANHDWVVFGPGAVSRVHPEWFGAARDGATEDFSPLQAAINSLPAGGILYLTAGIYKCNGIGLILKSNMTIEGDGKYAAMIKANRPGGIYDTLYLPYLTDVTIRNVGIDNQDLRFPYNPENISPHACIGIVASQNITIDNVYCTNSGRDGIWVVYSGVPNPSIYSKNISITNCHLKSNTRIGAYAEHVKGLTVAHNLIEDFGQNAVSFEPDNSPDIVNEDMKVLFNRILVTSNHNGSWIIGCQQNNAYNNCNNLLVEGNEVIGNPSATVAPGHAFYTQGCPNTKIVNNTITDLALLASCYSDYSCIQGNILRNSSTATGDGTNEGGISLSCNHSSAIGNILQGPGFNGIMVYGGKYNVVEGNTVINPGSNVTAPGWNTMGILLLDADWNTVANNIIRDERAAPIMKSGVYYRCMSHPEYQHNRIMNNQVYGYLENALVREIWQTVELNNGPMQTIQSTGLPTLGTWAQDSVVWKIGAAAGGSPGWVCTQSGTFTAMNVTGNTDATDTLKNVSDTSGIAVGDYVTVSQDFTGVRRVVAKTANTLKLDAVAAGSHTGVTIQNSVPVFKAMANLAG